MRILFFLLAAIVVVGGTAFFFPDVMDRTIQEGICPMVSLPVCEERQEANAQDDQSVPPWERDGHEPVTPASSPPQTEPTSPQVTQEAEQRTEQPELVSASAPASEAGVDQWGRRYDALIPVPQDVPLCGAMRISRGFSQETPQRVVQSFTNAIITRICSVPPDQRVFPEGEVCESAPNWHREVCYTFRGTP